MDVELNVELDVELDIELDVELFIELFIELGCRVRTNSWTHRQSEEELDLETEDLDWTRRHVQNNRRNCSNEINEAVYT